MAEEDPIVEEARRAGQAYIEQFGGDLKAVFADLRRRTKEEGRVVAAPPARPTTDATAAERRPQAAS